MISVLHPTKKQFLRVSLLAAACSVACGGFAVDAFAQSTNTDSNGYQQPLGEQPDFNKKYRPNVPSHELVFELNPLLLIRKSFAIEIEKKMTETITVGGDLIYRDALVYDENDLKGRVQFLGVAPKLRFYPYQALDGFFFGAKVSIGQTNLSLKSNDVTTEKGVLTLSPTAHAGYRFSTFSGFTLALYAGGGLNVPKPELTQSDLKAENKGSATWNEGRDKVNESSGLFKPDLGLTVGVSL